MPTLILNLGPEPHWPDLAAIPESVIQLGNDAKPIQIASLPGGMGSGRTSVCLRIDLPDGCVVLAETSLTLFMVAARGLLARYPDEVEPEALSAHRHLVTACRAARAALRSYQYDNASPELATEVADFLDDTLRYYPE